MGSVDTPTIGVVDLHDFEDRKEEIVTQLMDAATDVGFLQLVNHGITQDEIDHIFQTAVKFFQLPDEVKRKNVFEIAKNVGWESGLQKRQSYAKKEMKESIQLRFHDMEGKWPSDEDCPAFKQTAQEFMNKCQGVSLRLLSCFAIGMGLPEGYFSERHNPSESDCQQTLRMMHYFNVEKEDLPADAWRAGSHTDFETITLLFQRESGLEVCPGRQAVTEHAHGSVFTPVEPKPGAITVNIGDALMRWSDDKLKSNYHRVRMPREGEYRGSRYSIAFFNQANKKVVIQGPEKKYPAITAEEFVKESLQSIYAM